MEGLKDKRLLLLGGSLWWEAINDFAKENGIVLIATGNNRNAKIFEIADECYNVDSTDIEAMKKLILDKNIDGVYMGGSEPVIAAASIYLNELNMPCYCTHEQWLFLADKSNFKNLCMKFGLPVVPKYDVDFDDIMADSLDIDFPVITKPTDGCGSSGFSLCNNIDELKAGYAKAKQASATGGVLVEKFVKNSGVVVFYTFSEGKMYFSGLEDKYPVRYEEQGSYVAGSFVFESRFTAEFRERYENRLEEMFKSIKIKEGPIWIEVFHDGDSYYFNEVGYRYGGSVSVYPVDYFYQINQVSSDMYYALTGKSRIAGFPSLIKNSVPRKKYYCVYCVHMKPGKICSVTGIDEMKKQENVVDVPVAKNINDVIESTGTYSQVYATVHFVFDDVDEYKVTINNIHDTIRIIDDKEQNLVNRMIDIDLQKLDL